MFYVIIINIVIIVNRIATSKNKYKQQVPKFGSQIVGEPEYTQATFKSVIPIAPEVTRVLKLLDKLFNNFLGTVMIMLIR